MTAHARRCRPASASGCPNSGPFAQPQTLLDVAGLVERLGYDRVWVHDHISWAARQADPLRDGLDRGLRRPGSELLRERHHGGSAARPARADRRRYRRARAAAARPADPGEAADDDRAAGRLAAHRRPRHRQHPGRLRGHGRAVRASRQDLDRPLDAMRAIIGPDQPVDFETESVSFRQRARSCRARTRLPLWVTGSSEAGLRRAALADGWLTVYNSVDEYAGRATQLRAFADEAGRDPAALDMGYETYVCVAADARGGRRDRAPLARGQVRDPRARPGGLHRRRPGRGAGALRGVRGCRRPPPRAEVHRPRHDRC